MDMYNVETISSYSQDVEVLHLKVSKEKLQPIHIILTYKPPTINTRKFTTMINETLLKCKTHEAYLMGDCNIDLLKHDTNTREFKQIMIEHNF